MKLTVKRFYFSDKATIGELLIDGKRFCFTLEDKDRHLEDNPEDKVFGETAIPRGTYAVGIRYSPHFKAEVPWVKDVPGYEWVLIHWGNKPEDTEGCLLVGDAYTEDWVSNSRATSHKLFNKIMLAVNNDEEVTLEVL